MHAHPQQVTAALLALNGPDIPFVFRATPTGAVGTWNYADAKWAGAFAAGAVNRTFEMHVELHDDGTFTITDRTSDTSGSVAPNSASFSHTQFTGKVWSVSFNSSVTPIASDHGQLGHTFGWKFDSEEMKQPARDVLAQLGWSERKSGFWSRLFGG